MRLTWHLVIGLDRDRDMAARSKSADVIVQVRWGCALIGKQIRPAH